jgi:hypothetical protein
MVMNTEINFKNETAKPVTISPINSSVGRWSRFTLKPGEEFRRVSDSNGGSGNYDIEFRVEVNPKGQRNDVLIGRFRADNPWIRPYYIQSLDESVWYGETRDQNDPIIRNKQSFYTQYFKSDSRIETDRGDKGIFGKADKDKMKLFNDIESSGEDIELVEKYYTATANSAFDQELPFAKVVNLGDGRGTKAWNFVVDTF